MNFTLKVLSCALLLYISGLMSLRYCELFYPFIFCRLFLFKNVIPYFGLHFHKSSLFARSYIATNVPAEEANGFIIFPKITEKK